MRKVAFIFTGVILVQIPALAHAGDCRESSTENCFFSASEINSRSLGTLSWGSFYFKSDGDYNPSDRNFALVSSKGGSSIYLYDRGADRISAEIAKITGPGDAYGEAFTMELSTGVTSAYEGAHDETYSYCHVGSFGAMMVTAAKTVRETRLARTDGTPVYGSMKSIELRSESGFHVVSSTPVDSCPEFLDRR
jgi:hypothetical protein